MAKSSASHVSTLAGANRKPNPIGGTNRAKSIEFKKADNGLVSTMRTDGVGNDGPMYTEPNTTIHPSMSHAIGHLEKHFGDTFAKGK